MRLSKAQWLVLDRLYAGAKLRGQFFRGDFEWEEQPPVSRRTVGWLAERGLVELSSDGRPASVSITAEGRKALGESS